MIRAGRMAEFEIVQTEADVASQELNVEESANQVDSARLALLQLLALDLSTQMAATPIGLTASRRSGPPCSSNRNTCNA